MNSTAIKGIKIVGMVLSIATAFAGIAVNMAKDQESKDEMRNEVAKQVAEKFAELTENRES